MDLTNKNVTIVSMTSMSYPVETSVTVDITEEVIEGVFKHLDTFEIKFEKTYYDIADPALSNEIREKLALIP